MTTSDFVWVAAADRMPERGEEVLLFAVSAEGSRIVVGSLEQDSQGELYWESDSDEVAASPASCVTHWMPLPLPPR